MLKPVVFWRRFGPPASARAVSPPSKLADRAYQALTVAAMLLLIWSVWLFR